MRTKLVLEGKEEENGAPSKRLKQEVNYLNGKPYS